MVCVYEGIYMVTVHKLKVEWGAGNGAEVGGVPYLKNIAWKRM